MVFAIRSSSRCPLFRCRRRHQEARHLETPLIRAVKQGRQTSRVLTVERDGDGDRSNGEGEDEEELLELHDEWRRRVWFEKLGMRPSKRVMRAKCGCPCRSMETWGEVYIGSIGILGVMPLRGASTRTGTQGGTILIQR